jgi:hypothetical protein
MEILYKLFIRVVGGIIAQPSPRSKATAEKPNGHIGNEMTQVAVINVKLSFNMYRNLNKNAKRFYLRIQYFILYYNLHQRYQQSRILVNARKSELAN